MFYCNPCADKKGYPKTYGKSEGKCEVCGNHAVCNDLPMKAILQIKDTGSF